MRTQPIEPPLPIWEDEVYESELEAKLAASIREARRETIAKEIPAAHRLLSVQSHQPQITPSATETVAESTHAQLIAGCGIAAIDGYLAMREYAAAKGLNLIEFHHNGIDLQDLISTLVIHTQRMAELEGRDAGARRFRR